MSRQPPNVHRFACIPPRDRGRRARAVPVRPRRAIPRAASTLIVALCLAACTTARFAPRAADFQTGPLPTRRCREAFLVDATINGRGPYTLLLDTGAGLSTLTPRIAAEIGPPSRAHGAVFDANGHIISYPQIVHIDSLQIGGSTLRDFDAAVMDDNGFQTALGGRCDGVLTYTAFRDVLLTYDYPAGQVLISHGKLDPHDSATLPLLSARAPVVRLSVAQYNVRAIVDTGDQGDMQLLSSMRLRYLQPPRPVGSSLAAGSVELWSEGRLDGEITLAGAVLRQPVVAQGRIAHVGAEILRHFTVTFDQRSGLVRFVQHDAGPITFPSIRGLGVAAVPTPGGTLRIDSVFPESPARSAGLQAGDEITSIDGRPITEIACIGRGYWQNRSETALTIRRADQTLTVICPVSTLVP